MSEALTDYRLAEARSHRARLEEDAEGAGEENARIKRCLEAVRAAEESAVAATREAGSRFDDALDDFRTRLAIARHRLAAELAGNRHLFEQAVEAELRDWNAYIHRLQQRAAAAEDGGLPEPAQLAIDGLVSREREAAARLYELQTGPDEGWLERRERVEAAVDELERAARGLEA